MEPVLDISLFGVTQFFMLIGLFVLIVPIFPGLVIMWLAALGYGVASSFSPLGIVIFIFITLLMLAGSLGDNVLMGVSARKGGASWTTILLALGAGIVGTLILPPIGGLIAAPLVILLLEYRRAGNMQQAWVALRGLATGWGLSYVFRLLMGFLIMGLWWIWAWQG